MKKKKRADLVSFGNYLLDKHGTNKMVTHADIENWRRQKTYSISLLRSLRHSTQKLQVYDVLSEEERLKLINDRYVININNIYCIAPKRIKRGVSFRYVITQTDNF